MRFKFVFSAEWPSLPQCLALCLNIIIHSFIHPVGMSSSLDESRSGGFLASSSGASYLLGGGHVLLLTGLSLP